MGSKFIAFAFEELKDIVQFVTLHPLQVLQVLPVLELVFRKYAPFCGIDLGAYAQLWNKYRVTRRRYDPILSPSLRVVEQQLFITVFLPEFLETYGDKENL